MRWLRSPAFDLGWFAGPALLSSAAVLALPPLRRPDAPAWAWALLIIGVDVSHVYSTLYRVYLDSAELARRRTLYLGIPAACWAAGVLLHRLGDLAFWRVLAYLAVFHFVRQQYGFLRIYQRLGGDKGRLDAWIDGAALYGSMLYPLAVWHATLPRRFAWFMEGDFVPLPASLAALARALYGAALAAFLARQLQRWTRGDAPHPGKAAIVLSTAAAWYVGIVLLDSDLAFTATNVIAHGVPYFALVWLCGRRKWAGSGTWLEAVHRPRMVLAFLGLVLLLAYEEGAWDVLIWKEHASLFGGLSWPGELPPGALSLLVPLLAVPQATHYALDGWIWRLDGSNPGLREILLGSR